MKHNYVPFSVDSTNETTYFANTQTRYIGVVENGLEKPFYDTLDALLNDAQYLKELTIEHKDMLKKDFEWLRIHSLNTYMLGVAIEKFTSLKHDLEKEVGSERLSEEELQSKLKNYLQKTNSLHLEHDLFLTQDEQGHLDINVAFKERILLDPVFEYRMVKLMVSEQQAKKDIATLRAEKNKVFEEVKTFLQDPKVDMSAKEKRIAEYEQYSVSFEKMAKNITQIEQVLAHVGLDRITKAQFIFFNHLDELERAKKLNQSANNISAKREKFLTQNLDTTDSIEPKNNQHSFK